MAWDKGTFGLIPDRRREMKAFAMNAETHGRRGGDSSRRRDGRGWFFSVEKVSVHNMPQIKANQRGEIAPTKCSFPDLGQRCDPLVRFYPDLRSSLLRRQRCRQISDLSLSNS